MEIKEIDLKERAITIFNDVEEGTMATAIEKIFQINREDEEWIKNVQNVMAASGAKFNPSKIDIEMPHIQILLSTYGGCVYDGLSLYDAIKNSKTEVDITCFGKIMSMGIVLLLSAKTRKAYRNTTFMIHEMTSGYLGKLADMENDLEESKRLQKTLWDIITSETKITQKQLDDIYEKKKDWYLSAEEALEYGLITEII
jgi:ATP-dependent Clp endopeptidase proteolytic subunit ClpP